MRVERVLAEGARADRVADLAGAKGRVARAENRLTEVASERVVQVTRQPPGAAQRRGVDARARAERLARVEAALRIVQVELVDQVEAAALLVEVTGLRERILELEAGDRVEAERDEEVAGGQVDVDLGARDGAVAVE